MSKAYKGYELLKEIADGKIKEGTKFSDNYHTYILRKDSIGAELTLFNETNETPDYSYFADNDNTFTVIGEEPEIDIQGIEEIRIELDNNGIASKIINQLVQAVKQLDKRINNK